MVVEQTRKNPSVDASSSERAMAARARMLGRTAASIDFRRGVRKTHEQAVAFFEWHYSLPAWAADFAALEYERKLGGIPVHGVHENPLTKPERNGLIAAGATAVAFIAYAIFATKTTAAATAATQQPPLAPAQLAAIAAVQAAQAQGSK
jgi:hypothetical protein